MTILSAMQSAAIRLNGTKPDVFFSSGEQFEREICDLVNDVADDICGWNDWQALRKIHTIYGDGNTKEFPLPYDYARMIVNSDIQDTSSWLFGYAHVPDMNQFMYDKTRRFVMTPGEWIIYDNKIHFYPAPSVGQEAAFPYVSRNFVKTYDGNFADKFTQDTDKFIIRGGERLLTLGLVWKWREMKKLDYTGDQENFEKAIGELSYSDSGSNVIRKNSRLKFGFARTAWPYTLG